MRGLFLAVATVLLASCTGAPGPQTDLWNEIIVYPLINLLVLLYDILLHDFGLAIVVLTIALRLVLYPLFLQQLKSTRLQQELAPAMAELRRKHKDDRQRLAEEQMKLYKERGFNPTSGCLPIVLQMPILFGLYSALSQVGCGLGQLAGGACPGLPAEQFEQIRWPFVPNPIPPGEILPTVSIFAPWGPGLAHVDQAPIHIMPLIAAAVTFVSSLMTAPARQTAGADDTQARTMQMMVYYTPLLTLFFGWGLPIGLSLYWIVTTLFSIVQQWLTSGWGRLATVPRIGPFLQERFPSPAAPSMQREEREIVREAERDLAAPDRSESSRSERRRRKRRR